MNYSRDHLLKKKETLRAPAAKLGRKFVMIAVRLSLFLLVLGFSAGVAMGIGIFRSIIANAPNIENLNVSPSEEATFVYTADGTELQKLNASTANRIYVTIDKIPKVLQQAVVAIEDERFYQHNGIDPQGILRAAAIAVQTRSLSQGASTITQQLLKNNVFTGWTRENTSEKIRRKIQEQYLALKLEEVAGKDTILENYLNTINLGAGAYGVQAASLKYFNKDVSELNLSEATVLAGITKNPTRYNPITNPKENAARRSDVLAAMIKAKFITPEEAEAVAVDDVYSRIGAASEAQAENNSVYSYFMDAMIQQVIQDLQDKNGYSKAKAITSVYSGGLKIYATQDLNIQSIADEEFANEANYPPNTKWGLTYAVSIKHADGETRHYSSEHMTAYYQASDAGFHMQFYSKEDAQTAIDGYRASIMKEGDTVLAESIQLAPQPQAAIAILDQHTGEVKAVVGGRGSKETNLSWNRATNSTRQPGSSIKPIGVYGPAIDTGGMTLAQAFNDAPTTFSNGTPFSNADNNYSGMMTIRRALQLSKNTVAVKVIQQIGTQTAYQYLLKNGITSLTEADSHAESIALGGLTNGASPLEMAGAYATFANDGVYRRPIFYSKI
ncbi:MAG: transglycosylase domain-containing protein, partial [Lachnospiraceae bacterium]|nr:transglycosylase domain-containing protein [Lachnospiraceae bacterium]